ncbi:hypothetical protein Snoj_83490 [Streptomyces nojiriensis]|uniref:Acyclic terpene utilisation N-terminal domain-containing protein n=1 Tax=Streptomyces nojiriensis TaxID=66374 RepID=A0ABQ3T218_9ACTN|nr:hypothetical protein Snoj_83490 [Streptomyces nojiriensis]
MRGEAPPPSLKVGVTRIGGWRNEVVFVLTGLDIEAKANLVRTQLAEVLEGVADTTWTLARTDHEDADTQETASALLRLVVRDPSPDPGGPRLTSTAIELALGSYPGFHVTSPPGPAQPYGVFTSTLIPSDEVPHTAVLPDGTRVRVPVPPAEPLAPPAPPALPPAPLGPPALPLHPGPPAGPGVRGRAGGAGGARGSAGGTGRTRVPSGRTAVCGTSSDGIRVEVKTP